MKDEDYLRECINLAKKGMGHTFPNPMVGSLIVKDAAVIGEGYHKKAGFPHAEIEALKSCKGNAKGATLYVNLEPCVHFGRTPPCAPAIIKAGISKVICANIDPNPRVSGQGIAALKQAGIEITEGVMEKEARELNEAFFTYHIKKRPFVAIKFAASLDGKLATETGDAKWITNQQSRRFARTLRGQYQGVCVGINTVLVDDPHLGVRTKGFKDPFRIILDSTLRIPLQAKVLRDRQVLIITTNLANQTKLGKLQEMGFDVIIFDEKIAVSKLLNILYQKEIISVLVEGGRSVLDSFIKAKVVDKVYAFHAPLLIGGVKSIKEATRLANISFKELDKDLLTIGYNH
ncbi:bifunctional diaminohydroxyphosphoribosylaminopyrimidine deaminase/5-amino-6-(5-phosphoribosylamino)uracil reductase RibD [Candidatus Daviesbacteria bacterium]|nr:bifunctional diaminohydroxyphosphoribosylaminopyrimidine deaminase/5-amino-6-(5-phosphoribosylamino)uracil reductase RibD [Candidatus Daviesbacteria bacterium]